MKKKETKEPKVIIAMPVTDSGNMKARTAHSVGIAIIGARGVVVDFLLRLACDIVSSRTWLVKEAIQRGGTHILFVDSDMVFGQDVIPKMLAHKKDIIGVEYNKRQFPLEGVHEPLDAADKEKLYKAKYVGMGLVLIDLKVFEKLDGAWFNFGRNAEGELVLGEDSWFCHTARDAGFDTWIDPTIKVSHCGEYLY